MGGSEPRPMIIELRGGGHRPWYVRMIVEEMSHHVDADRIVVVSTADAVNTPSWTMHMGDAPVRTEIVPGKDAVDAAIALVEHERAFVVVPDGEWLVRDFAALPADTRGAVLLLRAHPQPGVAGTIRFLAKGFLLWRMRRRLPGVRVFSLESTSTSQHPLMARLGIGVALDPVEFEPSSAAGQDFLAANGVPTDRPVALVIGDLSERKHVLEIVSAWERCGDSVVLALVGTPSVGVRAAIERLTAAGTRDALQVRFGTVSDEEFDTWIASVDAVFTIHTNPGPSGVLLKTWAAGSTAIVDDERLVKQVCRELGVRTVVAQPTPEALDGVFAAVTREAVGRPKVDRAVRKGQTVPEALGSL
jgi:hypothetical protein